MLGCNGSTASEGISVMRMPALGATPAMLSRSRPTASTALMVILILQGWLGAPVLVLAGTSRQAPPGIVPLTSPEMDATAWGAAGREASHDGQRFGAEGLDGGLAAREIVDQGARKRVLVSEHGRENLPASLRSESPRSLADLSTNFVNNAATLDTNYALLNKQDGSGVASNLANPAAARVSEDTNLMDINSGLPPDAPVIAGASPAVFPGGALASAIRVTAPSRTPARPGQVKTGRVQFSRVPSGRALSARVQPVPGHAATRALTKDVCAADAIATIARRELRQRGAAAVTPSPTTEPGGGGDGPVTRAGAAPAQTRPELAVLQRDLWVAGVGGYHTYRIPSLLVAGESGVVLAFAEGRRNNAADHGDIDVVLRRSTDGGITWDDEGRFNAVGDGGGRLGDGGGNTPGDGGSNAPGDGGRKAAHGEGHQGVALPLPATAPRIVCDNGPNSCSNPTPVFDAASGHVLVLVNAFRADDNERSIIAGKSHEPRRTLVYRSADLGLTWQLPVDITASIARKEWAYTAVGPGNGIQLWRQGPGGPQGRLVIPCAYVARRPKEFGSHVIYSDDHGDTWHMGGSVGTAAIPANEATVAELPNGDLMLNARVMFRPQVGSRAVATSPDSGATWQGFSLSTTLVEPSCQGSLISTPGGLLLFSNPASQRRREKLLVRASVDGGSTWPHAIMLREGPSAYSSLALVGDDSGNATVLCLYEWMRARLYKQLRLAYIPLRLLVEVDGVAFAKDPPAEQG